MSHKIITKVILFFTLFIFMGCKNKSNIPDIDKALSEVTTKFPQLPKGASDHYLFEKSVKNAKYNFEIQLYSEADTIADPQKILVFINSKNECHAIPLFSNTYRDYWGFKNEIPLPKIQKVKSTFSKEYLDVLIALKLNNVDVCLSVTTEMLISLLNCNKISSCDFSRLKNIVYSNDNITLDTETNYDCLKQKWKKNDEEILNTDNTEVDPYGFQEILGYLDRKNYRFHQVVLGDDVMNVDKNPKKIITSEKDLQIKSYRKDRISHMINL